jgi:hypothetical protein
MLASAVQKEELMELLEGISTQLDDLEQSLQMKESEYKLYHQFKQEIRLEKCVVLMDGLETKLASTVQKNEKVIHTKNEGLQVNFGY